MKLIRGLLLAVFVLVPLVFSHEFLFPYTFTKSILFYTLVEAGVVAWIALMFASPVYRLRWSLVTGAVSVWFGVVVLASVAGVDVSRSIWSGYERMMGLWTYAHLYIFFLMLVSVLRSEKDRILFLSVSLATAALVAGIGIVESIGSAARIESTLGNAAFLGAYLLLHVFMGLSLLLREERMSGKAVAVACALILIVWALALTASRAAFVGVVGGAGLLGILFLWWGDARGVTLGMAHKHAKKYIAVCILVGIVGIGSAVLFRNSLESVLPRNVSRLLTLDLADRTTQGRLLAWQVSWDGWKDRVLLGWGPENYSVLFDRHYDARLFDQEPWFDRAHNMIFDLAGTTGAMGLAAYAGVITACAIAFARLRKKGGTFVWESAVGLAFLGAYILHNMFAFDTLLSYLPLFLMLGIVASRAADGAEPQPMRAKNNALVASVMIALLLVLPGWYYGSLRPMLENRQGLLGWDALRRLDPDVVAIGYFDAGLRYNTYGDIELNRFFAEYVFEFIKQGGKRPRESMERLMIHAMERMEENIARDPLNVKWLMYQGELYNLAAALLDPAHAPRAEEYFARARALSPARPQIYLELAQARKVQGNIIGMWEALDALFEILPDYIIGHINAASLAIEVGDAQREEAHASWLLEHNEGLAPLRDAYAKAGRYADAVRMQQHTIDFEENVKNDKSKEEYATLYAQLAALQNLAGDKASARITAERVRALDPSRASEVEAFFKSL